MADQPNNNTSNGQNDGQSSKPISITGKDKSDRLPAIIAAAVVFIGVIVGLYYYFQSAIPHH